MVWSPAHQRPWQIPQKSAVRRKGSDTSVSPSALAQTRSPPQLYAARSPQTDSLVQPLSRSVAQPVTVTVIINNNK
jgi:hypothetical protein